MSADLQKLKSGHEVISVTGKELEELSNHFPNFRECLPIRLSPDGWFLLTPFLKIADRLFDFKFHPSDVLIMTYPKCGTTWTQEIVWTMRQNKNFDHPDANDSITFRAPFIEMDFIFDQPLFKQLPPDDYFIKNFTKICPGRDIRNGVHLQLGECVDKPRTLKTHLPFSFFDHKLIETCKVIFVARNPKDACLSFYHHHLLIKVHPFDGTFDDFVNHFINDNVIYSPYWKMMKQAWDRRDHPNLLFLFFEDMKADPCEAIRKINNFIQAGLTDEQIDKVVDYTSFKAMKERDPVSGNPGEVPGYMNEDVFKTKGGFFRKGEAGDWKGKFTLEQEKKIQEWSRKNLRDFGPDFPYYSEL